MKEGRPVLLSAVFAAVDVIAMERSYAKSQKQTHWLMLILPNLGISCSPSVTAPPGSVGVLRYTLPKRYTTWY